MRLWGVMQLALLLGAGAVSVMLWPQIVAAGTFTGQALFCIVLWTLFLLSLWWNPERAS